MMNENCLIWNVRGLNSRACRNVVREMDAQLISQQETKLDDCDAQLISEMCGWGFDYYHKPAVNSSGGILIASKSNTWAISNPVFHVDCITVQVTLLRNGEQWWLTCVYSPQGDFEKLRFLDDLRQVCASRFGTWVVCGDFNMIY